MVFEFSLLDLATIFSSPDIKQSVLELVIDNLIKMSLKGEIARVSDVQDTMKKLNISFDPVSILKRHNVIEIEDNVIILHPIVKEDLNLWPHLLDILRNRYGAIISRRIHDLGKYLRYLDDLSSQLKFLIQNLNLEEELLTNAVKGLFSIRIDSSQELMTFEESLRFYRYKDHLNKKALRALDTLGKNMHLITNNDLIYLKKTLMNIDGVAAQDDVVKREFTKFSVDAFNSGILTLDDLVSFDNTDELITLSLIMKASGLNRLDIHPIDEEDPISKLIRKFLERDLPLERKATVVKIISYFFKELLIKEGFTKDLNKFIQSFYHKDLNLKKTLFNTMKKMEIWTPIYKQKIKASSRNIILVNDLSGSMISSYIGQVELFLGMIDGLSRDIESEVVFMSFSNDTFAIKNVDMDYKHDSNYFLQFLIENTMGMTDLNKVFVTLLSGTPDRGSRFTPPKPDDTIVFVVSDLQETIGGAIDISLAEKVIRNCKKFFLSVPKDDYNIQNYEMLIEIGAKPISYKSPADLPLQIMKL
ncbi:MAG: hypothetical protein ACTSXU_11440, partial [Promethearchaeota archaeon]